MRPRPIAGSATALLAAAIVASAPPSAFSIRSIAAAIALAGMAACLLADDGRAFRGATLLLPAGLALAPPAQLPYAAGAAILAVLAWALGAPERERQAWAAPVAAGVLLLAALAAAPLFARIPDASAAAFLAALALLLVTLAFLARRIRLGREAST